jgi:HlyD family secretion protein
MKYKYLFTLALPAVAVAYAAAWIQGVPGLPDVPAMVGWTSHGASTIAYETTPIARGSVRKIVSTSGPVRALVTVSIGSQLSGTIEGLKVDFNSEVKSGDILAVIDAKTFEARVAQARADLLMARTQVTNQEAALKRAEAVLRAAERTATRQQTLATKGIAATATLDNALRDADVARADIAVATSLIENAKAQITQREAALLQAQIDLDRTLIRSPIDGTVISRTVDVGQTVAASLQAPELFKIAQDLRSIRIEAQVNEADVGAVAEGNPATFTVDAYPERRFTGRVSQVRLAATELQNVVTYTVIVEAENHDRRLFPGMTANVQIETATRDGVLRISNDALRYKPRAGTPAAKVAAAEESPKSQREERQQQMLERLKTDVGLDDAQVAKIQEELHKAFSGGRKRSGGAGAPGGETGAAPGGGEGRDPAMVEKMRQRMAQRVNDVVAAVITDAQRPAFEHWKTAISQERLANPPRTANVWVLDPGGEPQVRRVRLGLADEQFTEVLGASLKDGDRAIIRAREAKK